MAKTMRRLVSGEILITLALVAAVAGGLVANSRYLTHKRAAQRALQLATFDQAWETIRDKHFDPTLGGIDWPAVRDELRPRMAAAASRKESREILREMIGRLHQSHLALLPREALAATTYAREAGSVGIDLVLLEGKAIVRLVAEDTPAGRAGILPGWELTRVDGQDIPALIARLDEQLPPGSGHRMQMTDAVAKLVNGPLGSPRLLAFRNGDGASVERSLSLAAPPGRLAQIGNLPAGYVRMAVERLPDDVVSIAFDGFVFPAYVMRAYNEAMESFLDARGLVIDLRGNGGGLPEMVTGMLGWLTPERLDIGRLVTRDEETRLLVWPRRLSYAGPIAVLVDERCVSGAELFASAARRLPNARIFGTTTAGAVQGGMIERLPDGDALMFPFSDFRTPENEPLEGVGVAPDVLVEPTRAALLAGIDPALTAALAWIESQPPPAAPARRRRIRAAPEPPAIAVAATGASEIDPHAASVLDAFVAATGGREAYDALETRVVRATLQLGSGDGIGMNLTTTSYLARPARSLTIEASDYMGEARFGTRDGVVWESTLFNGTRFLDPVRRRLVLRSVRLGAPAHWRSELRRAEYLGIVELEGHRAHRLRLETVSGDVEEQWFDVETALLAKASTRLELPAGIVSAETFPSDYRWSGGVRLPYRQRTVVSGQERTTTIESIEHNVELSDDLFRVPEELRQAVPDSRPD